MKKLIISLVVGSLFLFSSSVDAKKFTEKSLFISYNLKVVEKAGSHYAFKGLYKISDEENKPYFMVNPLAIFYYSRDYNQVNMDLDPDLVRQIAKIIVYGYGYKNQNTNEYYFATQYLIEEAFPEYTVFFADSYGQPINIFTNEIDQIKQNMEGKLFTFEDQTITSRTLEIEDPYILENFRIQAEHTKMTESDTKITIDLLDDLDTYTIQFVPKVDCKSFQMWQNDNIKFFHTDQICENSYTRTITVEKVVEEPKEEEPKKETSKKKNQKTEQKETKVEETTLSNIEDTTTSITTDVKVPSTSKNSVSFLFFFTLFGNLYYVFKK